jgi:hypothetical protein
LLSGSRSKSSNPSGSAGRGGISGSGMRVTTPALARPERQPTTYKPANSSERPAEPAGARSSVKAAARPAISAITVA